MPTDVLCTVVIPAYNTGPYVRETIDSVLAQTYRPIEVVVVDDGSTDDTAAQLATFGGAITVVAQPNSGPGRARNVGVRTGRGELVAFVDSDDVWKPERLARCVARLEGDRDVSIVTTDAFLIEDDVPTERTYYGNRPGAPTFPPPERQLAAIVDRNFVFSSAVFRRAVFEGVGGFDEDRAISGSEDYDLWLRMIASGARVALLDEPLAGYRVRPGNFTSDVSRQWQTHLSVLERNLQMLWSRGARARGGVYFEIANRRAGRGERREALRALAMGARADDLAPSRRARAVAAGIREIVRGPRRSPERAGQ